MIPKKGEKTNIKNYRPISSTSCIMKLFEEIIQKRITSFLTEKNLIIKQQSGFKAHRQCKDNLVFICQKILESYCHRKKACCIFYDIQSAFKVWHAGLMFKIIKLGAVKLGSVFSLTMCHFIIIIKINTHYSSQTTLWI